MKKKLLSIILSVFMLLFGISLLPITASAETEDASEQVTSDTTYKQVTSVEGGGLEAGAKYLIVCPSKGKAMGAQSGNYRQGVDITITDGRTNWADGVQVVTLGGTADAWTLIVDKTETETEYLYWEGGNNLYTGATAHEWTIGIENDGTATIASKNTPERLLRWNASYPRFSCYTSTQTKIALFKLCTHANTEAIGEAKAATCTEDGITAGEKCKDCGEVTKAQESIPATGHTDVNPADSKCDVCGTNLCAEHVWVDGDVITEPTCTATGLQAQYCQNCNEPGEDKVLDKIPHTPEIDEGTEATCLETGLTEGSHCSVCQEVLTAQEILPIVAHDYVDGKCSVCRDMVVSGKQLAVFEFGDNGDAKHDDGTENKLEAAYTDGDYTLSLTGTAKVYGGAFDATGNSALKLGTGSVAASFSFTVGENVTKVVISIAGYKANSAKIKANGTDYTIISKSDNGLYTNIVVNTAAEKTVTLTTLSGGYRAMINSITFLGEENAAAGEANELAGYTVTLGDSIGVNFYMVLTAETLADEGAYMQFTLPNGNVETVSVKDSQANGNYYKFTCYVAVKETVDDITAQLHNESGALTDAYTYSVKEYATYIVNAGSYTEKEVALAKALLNYGGYAQVMFDYKTDALANAELSEEDKNLANVTIDETYAKSVTGTVAGATYKGTTTIWEADMAIRHYFDITGESVTFKLYDAEGTEFIRDLALLENENGKYVAIDGIVAKDMATAYTLVISNGAEEQKISYSVYSYFYDILSSDEYEEGEKNAMKAAYLYAEAAIAYLAK